MALSAVDRPTAEDRTYNPSAHSPPDGASPDGPPLDLNSWPHKFVVPWTRMPACLMNALALSDRPTPKSRREMVRVVVDEMRLHDLNPTRANCVTVAKKMVREYPDSLADTLSDGARVGSGYASLVTQIKTRVEHLNRGNDLVRHRRPKRPSLAPPEEDEVARWHADQFGRAPRQPDRPPHEADELLRRKRQELEELFGAEGPAGAERGCLGPLMEDTYHV